MKLILPEDSVCYNCDNYVRNTGFQSGECLLTGKTEKDDCEACKKFVERLDETAGYSERRLL